MNEGTTILGLDQAIRATGVARWRDGRLSTMTIRPPKKVRDEDLFTWVGRHIWPLCTTRTFVVIEEPFVGKDPRSAMRLAGLYWHIRVGLRRRNVPFGIIGNGQLKKFATGNGNADKSSMVALAAATFGPGAGHRMGPWTAENPTADVDTWSHEADALFAMSAGLFHYWWQTRRYWELPAMEPGISDDQRNLLEPIRADWPDLEDWNPPQ